MKWRKKSGTVASRQPWLYIYALYLLLSTIISSAIALHTKLPSSFSQQTQHRILIFDMMYTIVINGALVLYFVTEKSIRRILVVLKILFVLNVIALPFDIWKKHSLWLALPLMATAFGFTMLTLLSKTKTAERETGIYQEQIVHYTIGSKISKMMRYLFRFSAFNYGATIIFIGMLLWPSSHISLALRYAVPLFALGIAYSFPYYLLKWRLRLVYTVVLIAITTAAIICLHLSPEPNKPAPADLPISIAIHNPFALLEWIFFHSSSVFAFFSILVIIDAIASKLKALDAKYEEYRAVIMLTILFLLIVPPIIISHWHNQTTVLIKSSTSQKSSEDINTNPEPTPTINSVQNQPDGVPTNINVSNTPAEVLNTPENLQSASN